MKPYASAVEATVSGVIVVLTALAVTAVPEQALAFVKTSINIDPQSNFNDFVVEPGKTEIFLNPGESMVKNISVTSRVNRTVKFKLTTEDFVGTDDAKQPVVLLGDNNSPFSLKDFIVPEISEFSLEFGEKITIPVTVSVPIDAEPRGYYGALIVSNDPDTLEGGGAVATEGQTRIISRIGSLFLLRITGVGKEEGSLENFKIIGPTQAFYTKRPVGFEITFKNNGNVHLVPYGTIEIKNMFGKAVDTLAVDAYFVLPNSTRYTEINWYDSFSIGRYTANLALYKGYNNEYSYTKLAFWIIPWKVLIPVLVGIFLIVLVLYYVLTHFRLSKKTGPPNPPEPADPTNPTNPTSSV